MTARTIRVLGTPAPQGSKRHVGRDVPPNEATLAWAQQVREEAAAALALLPPDPDAAALALLPPDPDAAAHRAGIL